MDSITEPFAAPAITVLSAIYGQAEAFGTPSMGGAIVLLAVAVRISMYPFRWVQHRAMKSVVALFKLHKKRMAIIKANEGNEEKTVAELDRLHKEHGIAPLRDCAMGFIPIFVQIVVGIGVFSGLRHYAFPDGASFLSVKDLASPDESGFVIALIILRFILYRITEWHRTGGKWSKLGWFADTDELVTAIISSFVLPSGLWLYMLASSFASAAIGEQLWRATRKKEKAFSSSAPAES